MVNLLMNLRHKLNFIIGMCAQEKTVYIVFGTIRGLRYPLGVCVLECIPCGWGDYCTRVDYCGDYFTVCMCIKITL